MMEPGRRHLTPESVWPELAKAWRMAALSEDLTITDGRGLFAAAGGPEPRSMADVLDEAGLKMLRRIMSETAVCSASSALFTTRTGEVIEVFVVRKQAGADFHFRNIGALVASVDTLAIFYRNFLNTPIATCFTDTRGNIVEANAAFLDLYGYSLEEVRGQNPKILKSGRQSPAAYQALWASITDPQKGFWSGELINRKKSGEEVCILITISSVLRQDGSLLGYIASALDITKRKSMEADLEDRNRELEQLNRFKSEMMAITSHDLKAPLNAMVSYAELLKEQWGSLPEQKSLDYLTRIGEYGKQLTNFISDLLDLTKIESGKFQIMTHRARLDAVLQGCIDINQAHSMSKGIRIRFLRRGKNRTSVVDVMRMAQVFNNILSNAVKFSPEGGEITVTYHDDGGGLLSITVEDQGPGIPDEDLQSIFNQYYQVMKEGYAAKRGFGAGIGLSVVKTIVELHKGYVSVENLAGRGCRFSLELPVKTFTSLKGLAVLVFDPEGSIFGYIEKTARSAGVDCFTAVNLRETARIAEFENPDVIFVRRENLSPEMRAFLETLATGDPDLLIVSVGDSPGEEDALFLEALVTPVVDIEIHDILKRVLSRQQYGANT